MRIRLIILAAFFLVWQTAAFGGAIKIAILDAGDEKAEFSDVFAAALSAQIDLKTVDKDLARAAANGANFQNSFNLSLDEAKNLGTVIDCDFFFVIKSEIAPRSSFQKNHYFEASAVIFLASARTGRLINWRDAYFTADAEADAAKSLLAAAKNIAADLGKKIVSAAAAERAERAQVVGEAILIEELPDEDSAAAQNFRIPLPYKRLRPAYTTAARRRDVTATVDVTAELNERGEVTRTTITRWAGFDLDEAAAETVKKMQFRPALRNGKAIAVKILLRYNFRDLSKQ